MLIFGITGTIGAGKGTIVEYLITNKNFSHYSVRAYLIEIIRKRGLEVNRDSMVLIANELRAQNSPSYVVDQLYLRALESGKNCIIESIRTPGEVLSLRKKENFHLFAVDADPKIRYQRIIQRNSETDQIDFDTFLENEKRELNSTNPNHQNLQKCIEMADFRLNNDGSIEQLHQQIEHIIKSI